MSSKIIENILRNNQDSADFSQAGEAMRRLLGYGNYEAGEVDNTPIDPKPPSWEHIEDRNRSYLYKSFNLTSSKFLMYFLNEIYYFSEKYHHYPEIFIKELDVEIVLYTEDLNDVTDIDIQLSKEIDDLVKEIDTIRWR